MTELRLAGVQPEPGRRQYPRWQAVWAAPGRAWHITLPLRMIDTSREEATAYALERTNPLAEAPM